MSIFKIEKYIQFNYLFTDLWIDYIQFVYEHCNNKEKKANKIFRTALNLINPRLCCDMSYKFKKLRKYYVYVLRIVFFNHGIRNSYNFFFLGMIHVGISLIDDRLPETGLF